MADRRNHRIQVFTLARRSVFAGSE
ncbi:hypothetical protein [Paenibacillus alginolyticus]